MRAADKRNRLVQAALGAFQDQGVSGASIAAIASGAGVPLGNVYYYFATKDALASAVVAQHLGRIRAVYEALERHDDPLDRLLGYLDLLDGCAGIAVRAGCPITELTSELRRNGYGSSEQAAALYGEYQAWIRLQMAALGIDDPEGTADELFALIQGAYAIARATGDEAHFRRLIQRAKGRVQALRPEDPSAGLAGGRAA